MINKNEIRIGNLVQIKYANIGSDGSYFSPNKIKVDDFVGIEKYHNNYRPIPVTEDILVKCGLEKATASDPYGGYLYTMPNDNEKLRVVMNETEGWIWVLYGCNNVKLPYLHTFQNLIHSITGEELKIDL